MVIAERREFQAFVKPVGARCNLNCTYCYYNDSNKTTYQAGLRLMNESVLEKYIIQHFDASTGPVVFFSWHGGEPLLAGIRFFEKALKLQEKFKPDGVTVRNGIQTNGTLLDEAWCSFLAVHNFYVGISIDGTRELHDEFRRSKGGAPSFKMVAEGFASLCDNGIIPEILCVVNRSNVSFPHEVYGFFKSLGAIYITFIPLVTKNKEATEVESNLSVPSLKFGEFLCRIFDEWSELDIGRIKIQIIEEALRSAFDQDHTLCIFKKRCGGVPAIELNGDFYSCDHFADDQHFLGNIDNLSLADLLGCDEQIAFGSMKEKSLPRYCTVCDVREMCNGECPKNRFAITSDGEPGLNYLCEGYRMFFRHIRPFADSVRAEWLKRNSILR